MSEQHPAEESADTPTHWLEDAVEVDATVRIVVDDSTLIADVESVGRRSDGAVASFQMMLSDHTTDRRPDIWDAVAQYRPDEGWGSVEVSKRVYGERETTWESLGTAESITVITTGINPDRLDPGVTVEMLDGDRYRIVIPPWERDYDDKALSFNLDSKSNVCERIDPEEVIRRVE
jgi:hypothetical protein